MENISKTFIEVPYFTKKWFELGFNDDDLARLQYRLAKDPKSGVMVQGTGGIRKIRFAIKGKGKSSGARVCYVDFAVFDKKMNVQKRNSVWRNSMSKYFEELEKGLKEAIQIEKGQLKGKKTIYTFLPIKKYSNTQVKKIRNNAGMTQNVFANYMGVSVKTVEAWERGTNHPVGPACRLISMLENQKDLALELTARK